MCDIIIYKRGTLSVADTKEIQRDGRMFWPPEAPNPKNQENEVLTKCKNIHFHCYMSLDWADGTEFIGTRNDPALTPIAELTDREKKGATHLLGRLWV